MRPLFSILCSLAVVFDLAGGGGDAPIPAHPLLVTQLGDSAFDAKSAKINLRAAITWATRYPDLAGEDGTPSKITFDKSLWAGKSSPPVIYLSCGRLTVGERCFTEHPLVIAGPGRETCALVIDGWSLYDRILDVADGNAVVVQDLAFREGSSADEGGAIRMAGGSLRLTNCVFEDNSAASGGGAVYLGGSGGLKVMNCRFEGNESSGQALGGGAICADGRLTVVNSSFWQNSAKNGGAIWCAATNLVVNSSFFKNRGYLTGGGVYSSAADALVALVNCTLNANIADSQEGVAENCNGGGGLFVDGAGSCAVTLVNDFFIGNRQSSLLYPDVDFGAPIASLQVYASMFGKAATQIVENVALNVRRNKEEMTFFEKGERTLAYRQLTKAGVKHDYLMSMDTVGDYGCTVWYDADWDNVAFSPLATAAKISVVGDAALATQRLWEDISTRDLRVSSRQSQCGSFWYVHDHPENGTVVTRIDDAIDYYDGQLTLREIVVGIATEEDKWRTNLVDGVYRITFTNTLAGQTLRLKAPQIDAYGLTNEVNLVIDGEDLGITIDGGNAYRAFRARTNATVTLRNLKFVNCLGQNKGISPVPGCDGGAVLNAGRMTIEGCSFESCSTGLSTSNPTAFGGAICNGTPGGLGGRTLQVIDSTFSGCLAAEGGAVYNYDGNFATLTGCSFTDNKAYPGWGSACAAIGGAICTVSSGELVYGGCTFTNNTIRQYDVVSASDVQAKVGGAAVTLATAAPHRTVRYANAVQTVELNERALPETGSMALDTSSDATMPDGSPAVSMQPSGLTPGLFYGLGHAATPEGPYVVEGGWLQAGADGKLPAALVAPKSGASGYYKVFAKE